MAFKFDEWYPDSPFIQTIWRTQSEQAGSFTSVAVTTWEMVVTRQNGKIAFTVRGPETKAIPAVIPEDAEFIGIRFKVGTFMPHLPNSSLVDNPLNLPEASGKTFWLNSTSWQVPDFDNADVFVERLVREGLLVREPIVEDVLKGRLPELSIRSIRRRFLRATGLTHGELFQIERAQQAVALLEKGSPILDVVEQAGYFDQPHLTRALRRFIGQTPAQILRLNQPE